MAQACRPRHDRSRPDLDSSRRKPLAHGSVGNCSLPAAPAQARPPARSVVKFTSVGRRFFGRRPNNSIKPNPLRGSAYFKALGRSVSINGCAVRCACQSTAQVCRSRRKHSPPGLYSSWRKPLAYGWASNGSLPVVPGAGAPSGRSVVEFASGRVVSSAGGLTVQSSRTRFAGRLISRC